MRSWSASTSSCKRSRARPKSIRATLMIGRSHGIHAEPITAGSGVAGFFSEVSRARRALVLAREEISGGQAGPARRGNLRQPGPGD